MTHGGPQFELPRNIDRHLAALSKLYAQEGERQKQEIIVNAQVRVHEEWSRDNWNGGTYGHALYLTLPESLYLASARVKDELQTEIKNDLNKIHNVQNEFIEEVFLEMVVEEDQDWRRDSGLLQVGKRDTPPETTRRIWGDSGYRVFLSHNSEIKKETAKLKAQLTLFGISCFVAHEDIDPTREWQDEIESALHSMDAFLALMTEGFHDSLWTDQEVGFALGHGVPIVAVKLGKNPYGFIGKFQALTCDWGNASKEIVKLLIKHPRMLDAYIDAVRKCSRYDDGNTLAELLPYIERLTERQAQQMVAAFNENTQVRESYGFNGTKPSYYGVGLAVHLSRATGCKYRLSTRGKMQLKP
jgi:hypothetical protein